MEREKEMIRQREEEQTGVCTVEPGAHGKAKFSETGEGRTDTAGGD